MSTPAVEAISKPPVRPLVVAQTPDTPTPVSPVVTTPQQASTTPQPSLEQISSSLNNIQKALENPSGLTSGDLRQASFLLNKIKQSLDATAAKTPAQETDLQTQIKQLQEQLKTLLEAVKNLTKGSSQASNAVGQDPGSSTPGNSNNSTGNDTTGPAKKLAGALVPGLGQALDTAEKIPIVGDVVKAVTKPVSKLVSGIPILKNIFG
jgi:hypothetical protein